MIYAQLVAGFIYLLGGGDLLVRGAVALARRTGVPSALVALTVVGLGTSLPELVVSVRAASTGHPGLALGNVVGSNIANVLLVGGVAAIVFPLRTGSGMRRSGELMLLVTVFFIALCAWGGSVTRLEGFLLVGILLVGTMITARVALRARTAEMPVPLEWVLGLPTQLGTIALFVGVGLVVLPLGADLLVDAATQIATRIGVSDTIIGLSVVALGTSLPEVATTVVAGLRRKTVMVVGTLVGSNMFNILAIMGAAAVASPEPISVSTRSFALDLPVMAAASLALVAFIWFRRAIARPAGTLFLTAYTLYVSVLFVLG